MLNSNKDLVNECLRQLKENKEKYGKPYCPCIPPFMYSKENNEDYICPCKDFRENVKEGQECHCGLYIK